MRTYFAASPPVVPGALFGNAFTEFLKLLYKAGKGAAKPAGDFTRGFAKGAPKAIPIGGQATGTTSTVTASLRAGMQVRYIAVQTGRVVLHTVPTAGKGVVKYIGRTALQDTIVRPILTPIYYSQKGFALLKVTPKFLKGLESRTGTLFDKGAKYLATKKLAPSIPGLAASLARGTVIGYIEQTTGALGNAANAIHQTAVKYLPQVSSTAGNSGVPVEPSGGRVYLESVDSVPRPGADSHGPSGHVTPAPAPDSQGARSRRYIPVGGR